MFSPPGRSILITSAPDSASINVAKGPGKSVVKSRTRRPESGCMRWFGCTRHGKLTPEQRAWRGVCVVLNGGTARIFQVKQPRQFNQPLAIGAPAPLRELPVRLERMIHFVDRKSVV